MLNLPRRDLPLYLGHVRQNILVPVGHVIMWSVLHLLQDEDFSPEQKLMVSIGGQAPTYQVWTGTATVTPDPAVHKTKRVFVEFFQEIVAKFRLIFSFHKVRILSQKRI